MWLQRIEWDVAEYENPISTASNEDVTRLENSINGAKNTDETNETITDIDMDSMLNIADKPQEERDMADEEGNSDSFPEEQGRDDVVVVDNNWSINNTTQGYSTDFNTDTSTSNSFDDTISWPYEETNYNNGDDNWEL